VHCSDHSTAMIGEISGNRLYHLLPPPQLSGVPMATLSLFCVCTFCRDLAAAVQYSFSTLATKPSASHSPVAMASGYCAGCLETQRAESATDFSCCICGGALTAANQQPTTEAPAAVLPALPSDAPISISAAIQHYMQMIEEGTVPSNAIGLPGLPPDVLAQLTGDGGPSSAPAASAVAVEKLPRFTVEENSWILYATTLKVKGLHAAAGTASERKRVLVIDALMGEFSAVPDQLIIQKLVLADPLTVESDLVNAAALQGAIAVVQRGGTTFASKALRLQSAGAAAVIVLQTADVWPYIMKDPKQEAKGVLRTPVCMVNKAAGALLIEGLRSAAAAAGAAAADSSGAVTCELSVAQSKKECVICQEVFAVGATFVRLPCSHLFHTECAKMWLQRRSTCPTCRFEVPTGNADYDRRAQAVRDSSNGDQWAHWFD
jgi:Ring finger domain/PA domain